MTLTNPYRGVFPVAPTIFDDRGNLDLDGQRRCVDFMIDAGSQGICILANFSEQFVLTDAERETVMRAVLEHVAGRVPVIVTTTHFSSAICAARSRQAEHMGAAMVMVMPPYHGATFRVAEPGIFEFYRVVSDAVRIPVMIQDAPIAGTPVGFHPEECIERRAKPNERLSKFPSRETLEPIHVAHLPPSRLRAVVTGLANSPVRFEAWPLSNPRKMAHQQASRVGCAPLDRNQGTDQGN